MRMDMQFDVLIPTQEVEVCYTLIEYADDILQSGFPSAKKMAKEIAKAKYWEAHDCENEDRQEYWRVVIVCFDTITNFKP